MTFAAGVVVGVIGTLVVSTVFAIVLIRGAKRDEPQFGPDPWAKPWPPRPVTEVTATPAEQTALAAVEPEKAVVDVDELIHEVEDLIRRKARS